MADDDIEYYRQRADAERVRASEAQRADVAEIHLELALMYDALVEREGLRPCPWNPSPEARRAV